MVVSVVVVVVVVVVIVAAVVASSVFQWEKTSDLDVCGEDEVNWFFKLFLGAT